MDSKTERTDGVVTLTLYGDVTIQSALELKNIFIEQIGLKSDLVVNLAYVTDCDLSLFQLLCATHKRLLKDARPIMISECSPAVREVMLSGGLLRGSGCMDGEEHSCLWQREEG